MERSCNDLTKPRKGSLVGSMAGSVDHVGSAISKNLWVAGDPGAGSGSDVAGDRWQAIYLYGIGRSGLGAGRLGLQSDYKRSLWSGRCHGHLVSGALSGLWYQSVHPDVGVIDGLGGIFVSSVVSEKVKRPVHSLYPLSDGGDVDPAGAGVDGRVRRQNSRCRYLRGSFTIEAALLIPLILGVLFLLLQTVVSLHDTVSGEARQYQQHCENEEQEPWRFLQMAGAVLEEWEEWKS